MSTVDLFLTREPVSGLMVAGDERVSCWLAKPRRGLIESDGFFSRTSHWQADVMSFPARAFRKIGAEAVSLAVWGNLERTGFPGIPYEEWESPDLKEHLGAVPHDEWIGTLPMELSASSMESAIRIELTLTGPFRRGTMYGEPRGPEAIAWLSPPRFEPGDRFGDDPFGAGPARGFWHQPDRVGSVMSGDFGRAGIADVAEAIRGSLARGRPDLREWSATVPVWMRLAVGCGD